MKHKGATALILCCLAGLAVTFAAIRDTPATVWRGDYETCNFSQWDFGVQQKAVGRASIVRSPVDQGVCAARFEVRSGDNNVAGSGTGERTEVLSSTTYTEGSEQYWAWSTMFDSSFYTDGGYWNKFTQWHNTGTTGGTTAFIVTQTQLVFQAFGGNNLSPTSRAFVLTNNRVNSHWYEIVFHVKWSSNPTIGFVEIWLDGRLVVPKTFVATLYGGQGVYTKQGYYRHAQPNTAVIYHDGMRRGLSYDEVAAEFPGATTASTTTAPATTSPPSTTTQPATTEPPPPPTTAPTTTDLKCEHSNRPSCR